MGNPLYNDFKNQPNNNGGIDDFIYQVNYVQ